MNKRGIIRIILKVQDVDRRFHYAPFIRCVRTCSPLLAPFAAQRKIKCRAPALDAFGPGFSVVPMDNALHRRQSNAGALEVSLAVQSLKRTEQFAPRTPCQSRRRCRGRNKDNQDRRSESAKLNATRRPVSR